MKRNESDHINLLATDEAWKMPDFWVFKLVNDIFGEEDAWKSTYIPGVFEALSTIEEYEQHVIGMRYMKGMTYEAIGEEYYGYTRERIRQILAKAMRKLRHPSRSRKMLGVSRADHMEINKQLSMAQAKLLSFEDPNAGLASILIENLDLSIRAYNCIKRGGYSSVMDFLGKDLEDLMRVRNLGRKSAEEIIGKLEDLNIRPDKDGHNFQLRDEQGNVVV